jgi:phosphoribosylamine--glycine ligase
MLLAAQRRLHELDAPPAFADDTALTVVMAAKGYPDAPEKGGAITIGETGPVKLFHAGTALKDGGLIANGGRVLNVTATAPSVGQAREAAYRAIEAIDFPGGFYRRDIGWREVAREG